MRDRQQYVVPSALDEAMTKSRGINRPKRKWSPPEDDVLCACYPFSTAAALAKAFACTPNAVYQRANRLSLAKSEWFKQSILSSRLKRENHPGKATQFKKGQVPPNKGIKGISYPGSVATQFKPGTRQGNAAQNYKPIGSERLTKDGYVQVKMTETGYPPRDWVGKQIIIWERLNGIKLPANHMVIFRDGDRLNFDYDNLELLSRAQNMKRNSFHNYGPEIAKLYQLKGAITRQINKREGKQ